MSAPIPASLRALVAARAQYRCGYCLTSERIIGALLEVDHIIPRSLGGPTEEANLWLACSPCNQYKHRRIAALDPLTKQRAPLFNPGQQRWSDHFAWSATGSRIIGLTPTGRATVIALRLNRREIVRARQRWVAVGWHPPHE